METEQHSDSEDLKDSAVLKDSTVLKDSAVLKDSTVLKDSAPRENDKFKGSECKGSEYRLRKEFSLEDAEEFLRELNVSMTLAAPSYRTVIALIVFLLFALCGGAVLVHQVVLLFQTGQWHPMSVSLVGQWFSHPFLMYLPVQWHFIGSHVFSILEYFPMSLATLGTGVVLASTIESSQ